MPQSIVSDRGKIFTSTFWQHLFALTNTQLCMSSAYHPQSDGQTERVNQCLETFLRCLVHAFPQQRKKWLALAKFWYNTSWHSAINKSPFEVLYGHSPRHFGVTNDKVCPVPELSEWLQEREHMNQLVKQHLLRAQQRMKKHADMKRTERSFQVGDMVFLKLQPYVQSYVVSKAN